MKFSDETLMAYADGELDAETRLSIEAAMAEDPRIAQEIARHRQLQAKLRSALDGVLTEKVPDSLLATARTAPTSAAKITPIADARTARTDAAKHRWSWPEWGAIAASVLIGIIVARAPWGVSSDNPIVAENGHMTAAGALASALTHQPGGTQDSPVQIGVSFRAKSGEYCRTFAVRDGDSLAGLACREADDWRIRTLAQSEPSGRTPEYRMAGAVVPPIIMQAAEDAMQGDALDAEAEAAALKQGWKP